MEEDRVIMEECDDTPCFFKRLKVIVEEKSGDLCLREFDSMCCDGSVIIEGFNKGLTSLMATKYIIEKLKLPLVGDIISSRFDTFTMVDEGLPCHGCRIYGNKRVVVFTSEYDFEAFDVQNDLVQLIYDFASRHRSKMIITVDGIPGDLSKPLEEKYSLDLIPEGEENTYEDEYDDGEEEEEEEEGENEEGAVVLEHVIESIAEGGEEEGEEHQEEEGEGETQSTIEEDEDEKLLNALKALPSKRKILEDLAKKYDEKIFYMTNDKIIGQDMEKMGHTIPVRTMAIQGISGGILSRSSSTSFRNNNNIPVICILGNLDPSGIGHTTAVSLIACVDKLLGDKVSIDLTDLTKENEAIERKLKELISSISDGPVSPGQPVSWGSMYL